jgi:PAS domain S-box-containing protein
MKKFRHVLRDILFGSMLAGVGLAFYTSAQEVVDSIYNPTVYALAALLPVLAGLRAFLRPAPGRFAGRAFSLQATLILSAIGLSVYMLLASSRSSAHFNLELNDINRSGSLRYRSAELPNLSGDDRRQQLRAIQETLQLLQQRYPSQINRIQPQWNRFLARWCDAPGRVPMLEARRTRILFNGLTADIEATCIHDSHLVELGLVVSLGGIIVVLMMGILSLRRTEKVLFDLRNSERRFNAFLDNSPLVAFQKDADGRMVYVNEPFRKQFGLRPGEWIGLLDHEIWPPEMASSYRAADVAALQSQQTSMHIEESVSQGRSSWFLSHKFPMKDEIGADFLGGMSLDITEQKLVEQEIRRMSEAKSQFLSTVSHEMRTPLNGILGMAAILASSRLEPEQEEQLQFLRSSGRNMLLLLNEILDYAKVESGKIELELAPFSLETLCIQAFQVITAVVSQKGLEVVLDLAPDCPAVICGDSLRLGQILMNLLANAAKFTDAGEIALEVGCERVSPSTVRCDFCVRDTGGGIDPENLANLFTPFLQAESSTARLYGGTGLGLSTSRKLAETMGGQLLADSEPGRGSRFRFSLLFEFVDAPALARQSARRVLLLEPHRRNRELMRSALEQIGHHCDVERAADASYDLAVVAYNADESAAAADLPRVAWCRPGRQARARQQGCRVVISKPLSVESLARALQRLEEPEVVLAERPAVARNDLRILAADDVAMNLEVLRLSLHKLGYSCDTVADGREALERLREQTYDLLLLDLHMPDLGGLDVTRELQMHSDQRLPRIVIVTADAMPETRAQCEAAGVDAVLIKPYTSEQLEAELTQSAPEALDQAKIQELRRLGEGHPLFLEQIAGSAGSDLRRLAAEIVAAGSDALAVSSAAHALQGAAGSVGAMRVVALAQKIRELTRNGTVDPDAYSELPALVERTLARLQQLLLQPG